VHPVTDIVFRNVTDELAMRLAETLASKGVAVEIESPLGWTTPRAESLLRDLPAFSRRIIRTTVEGSGWGSAELLREDDGSLRGRSTAIKRAVERGIKDGRFPEGLPVPVVAQYDPETPGWQRTAGFTMPEEHLPAFREAIARVGDETL
jgi:hypothetical protein